METNILFGCKGDEKERREEKVRKGKERERKEERVVHRRIALNNFFKRKVFFEKIMVPYEGLC